MIDPAHVGQIITIIVEVEVTSESAELNDAAKAEFAAQPEVQQCYCVTGGSDFVLVVIAPTMADHEQLTRRPFLSNVNIRKLRSIVAMDRVKQTLAVPIVWKP